MCIWMPRCQAAANRFCLLLCVPGASGEWLFFWSAAVFFQFIWLRAFVCDPHYNPEIKYTSKQLKLNKIKCSACHRRYVLIEHTYICLLISCSSTNFPLFIYVFECPQLFIQSCPVKVHPFNLCQCRAGAIFMCWVVPLIGISNRRQISLKPDIPQENASSAHDKYPKEIKGKIKLLCFPSVVVLQQQTAIKKVNKYLSESFVLIVQNLSL